MPPDFGQTPQGSLIAQDESGRRNIPNYRFDRTHTAGGHFQITDTNWKLYAPTLGIDLDQYPNAMSAPEQLQGQVAGKMYAETGFMPWAPFNPVLARHVQQTPPLLRKHAAPAKPIAAAAPRSWYVFAANGEHEPPSFVITAPEHSP